MNPLYGYEVIDIPNLDWILGFNQSNITVNTGVS